nr:GNAT family N-acetyltransferase [Blastococcus sp. DSM 46838]
MRQKRKADQEECLALLLDVHRTDGYPRYLPDDLRGFLTPPYEAEAWVAEEHGAVVGHVALHDAAVDPTLKAAQRATGLPAERLAVLARLLVSPSARRRGLGARLLRHATAHARSAGQRAVLDVTQDAVSPMSLYESEGWSKVESLVLHFDDKSLLLWVYVSPDAEDA